MPWSRDSGLRDWNGSGGEEDGAVPLRRHHRRGRHPNFGHDLLDDLVLRYSQNRRLQSLKMAVAALQKESPTHTHTHTHTHTYSSESRHTDSYKRTSRNCALLFFSSSRTFRQALKKWSAFSNRSLVRRVQHRVASFINDTNRKKNEIVSSVRPLFVELERVTEEEHGRAGYQLKKTSPPPLQKKKFQNKKKSRLPQFTKCISRVFLCVPQGPTRFANHGLNPMVIQWVCFSDKQQKKEKQTNKQTRLVFTSLKAPFRCSRAYLRLLPEKTHTSSLLCGSWLRAVPNLQSPNLKADAPLNRPSDVVWKKKMLMSHRWTRLIPFLRPLNAVVSCSHLENAPTKDVTVISQFTSQKHRKEKKCLEIPLRRRYLGYQDVKYLGSIEYGSSFGSPGQWLQTLYFIFYPPSF